MKKFGTRLEVMRKKATKTTGGLYKEDLIYNKRGKIVSKKKSINQLGGGYSIQYRFIMREDDNAFMEHYIKKYSIRDYTVPPLINTITQLKDELDRDEYKETNKIFVFIISKDLSVLSTIVTKSNRNAFNIFRVLYKFLAQNPQIILISELPLLYLCASKSYYSHDSFNGMHIETTLIHSSVFRNNIQSYLSNVKSHTEDIIIKKPFTSSSTGIIVINKKYEQKIRKFIDSPPLTRYVYIQDRLEHFIEYSFYVVNNEIVSVSYVDGSPMANNDDSVLDSATKQCLKYIDEINSILKGITGDDNYICPAFLRIDLIGYPHNETVVFKINEIEPFACYKFSEWLVTNEEEEEYYRFSKGLFENISSQIETRKKILLSNTPTMRYGNLHNKIQRIPELCSIESGSCCVIS
jgi:hypothetical protein